ncbi:MAG: helix-turn-helix domain-containing protein [Gammaproteobacteria bacterium]
MKQQIDSPIERGERVKRLRNLANLTRKEFCDASSDVNVHTLKGWEIGRYGGLTRKGAEKVLPIVAAKGVSCSIDWLLYGIGAGPTVFGDYEKDSSPAIASSTTKEPKESHKIAKELALFKQHYKNVVDFIVADDGMLPHYVVGSYIAGVKVFGEDIASLVGRDCIVHTKKGQLLFRRIHSAAKGGKYNLICLNTATQSTEPVLYEVELSSAAAVIWQRQPAI